MSSSLGDAALHGSECMPPLHHYYKRLAQAVRPTVEARNRPMLLDHGRGLMPVKTVMLCVRDRRIELQVTH